MIFVFVEDEVNFAGIPPFATVQNLALITKVLDSLVPHAGVAHFLCDLSRRSFLPDVVLVFEGADLLIFRDDLFHYVRAQVKDDLLWHLHASPRCWVELSGVEVERKLEYVHVSLPLLIEIQTELANSGIDAVHSAPSTMVVKLQFPPRNVLFNVICIELSKVEREPVHDVKEMGVLA